MRKIGLTGDPSTMGRRHGELLGDHVRGYLGDRIALAGDPYWSGRVADADSVRDLAALTVPAHEEYAPDLYAEMLAMAQAASITAADAVVVGGFTDLIDLVRTEEGTDLEEDDCTGMIDADNGVLAQTWDMHASAGKYVYLFSIEPERGPAALVQTTAGCLGQMGLNEAGIAVGINNLTSMGRVGVTWPFVVRKILRSESLDDAIKCVLDAPLAGGHNFFVMGPDGSGCNIEAMPDHRSVTRVDQGYLAHTNHCLDERAWPEEADRNPIGQESSITRLARMAEYGPDLQRMFEDPAINRSGSGHDVATCGAVVMRPGRLSMDAVWGRPGDHPWETFHLG